AGIEVAGHALHVLEIAPEPELMAPQELRQIQLVDVAREVLVLEEAESAGARRRNDRAVADLRDLPPRAPVLALLPVAASSGPHEEGVAHGAVVAGHEIGAAGVADAAERARRSGDRENDAVPLRGVAEGRAGQRVVLARPPG